MENVKPENKFKLKNFISIPCLISGTEFLRLFFNGLISLKFSDDNCTSTVPLPITRYILLSLYYQQSCMQLKLRDLTFHYWEVCESII